MIYLWQGKKSVAAETKIVSPRFALFSALPRIVLLLCLFICFVHHFITSTRLPRPIAQLPFLFIHTKDHSPRLPTVSISISVSPTEGFLCTHTPQTCVIIHTFSFILILYLRCYKSRLTTASTTLSLT